MPADLLLAIASGIALGASFLDFRLAAVAWAGIAGLLVALDGATPRRGFRLGFAAGLAGIALAFHWLIYAFRVFGGFSLPVAALLYVPPVAWMALQLGAAGLLIAWLGPLPLALGPPLAFTAIEFLFPSLFPWRLAHSQYRVVPLLQSGDLAGPYVLTFAMAWIGAAVALAVRAARRPARDGRRRAAAALAASVLAVTSLAVWGIARSRAVERARAGAPSVRIGVVQGNVGVEQKGRRALFTRNLEEYRGLSRAIAGESDVLIWPETVVQDRIPTDTHALASGLHPFPDTPRPLIFGGLAVAGRGRERRLFNSAFLVRPDGTLAARYDKRILVPFGEYMPFADRFPALRTLSPATGNFRAGTGPTVLAATPDARFGLLICYEDVDPASARTTVREGATALLNLTNDAWYGDTAQPVQHQALALWRAVETRRDLVRATNTGLTSVIAASGRVLAELPLFTAGTLSVEVRLLDRTTFYTAYGDVFGWGVVLAFGACALRRARR
jgi:apolipoprotein N-acyltransferase